MMAPLRVAYVPEHFCTPLFLAHAELAGRGVDVEWRECPSGTGAMCEMLSNGEIDVAVGLTEGFTAKISTGNANFRFVGSYVASPLKWSISVGAKSTLKDIKDLKGATIGISRFTSGSHIMSIVLAMQQGWTEPFKFEVLNNFASLRNAVNDGTADAFMWEYFTSNKYYKSGEIHPLSEILTPWPSWMIVARTEDNGIDLAQIADFVAGVKAGIDDFNSNPDVAIEFITKNLNYSEQDAREWLKGVKFSEDAQKLPLEELRKCQQLLRKAGAINDCCEVEKMICRLP